MEKGEKGGARCKAQCLPQYLPQPAQDADALDEPEAVSREDRDDVALALALVRAARSVEQVVDVSAGRYGTAITYGPGQRVTGIVLRRSAPSGTRTRRCRSSSRRILWSPQLRSPSLPLLPSRRPKGRGRKGCVRRRLARAARLARRETPVLLRIADETRRALAATLRRLRPGETWEIDITIDELRDTDARDSSRVQ